MRGPNWRPNKPSSSCSRPLPVIYFRSASSFFACPRALSSARPCAAVLHRLRQLLPPNPPPLTSAALPLTCNPSPPPATLNPRPSFYIRDLTGNHLANTKPQTLDLTLVLRGEAAAAKRCRSGDGECGVRRRKKRSRWAGIGPLNAE